MRRLRGLKRVAVFKTKGLEAVMARGEACYIVFGDGTLLAESVNVNSCRGQKEDRNPCAAFEGRISAE
jgi:hypothetical protein